MTTTTVETMAQISAIRQRLREMPEASDDAIPSAPPTVDWRIDEPHPLRQALQRSRRIIADLRELGDDELIAQGDSRLGIGYRHCVEATSALRPILMEDAAPGAGPIPTCQKIHTLLDALAARVEELRVERSRKAQKDAWLTEVMSRHAELFAGEACTPEAWPRLADAIIDDAIQGTPLEIISVECVSPASSHEVGEYWRGEFIASHALNTAAVAARAFADSLEQHPLVLAALVADVGLLEISWDVLAHRGRLLHSQRVTLEKHPITSSALLEHTASFSKRVVDAVRHHHEKPDGTGYPSRSAASPPLAQQLGACSVFAALLASRPYREANDIVAALTAVLLEAEHGGLDRHAVEALKSLAASEAS